MPRLKQFILKLIALLQRHPGLVAAFGFASGVASFVLVERKAELAKILALVLLVSWVWLTLENTLRDRIAKRFGFVLPPPVVRYATQMIHQESLFFVLPFFFITTTWYSSQLLFSGLLAVAALISITDPLYYRWLATKRWLYLSYHSLTLFAVLLTALPVIFKLTTKQSYELALATAMLLSLPSMFALVKVRRWWGWLLLLALPLGLGASGWWLRTWVPPATLWLNEVAISQQFDNRLRMPGSSLEHVNLADLHSQGLYAYTAISAPRGLNERIYHVWRYQGREIDRIALDIHGGRKEGYRAWTHKQKFPKNAQGDWQVQVLTEAGQMIGVLRFQVE
jgi:hypothetical protein